MSHIEKKTDDVSIPLSILSVIAVVLFYAGWIGLTILVSGKLFGLSYGRPKRTATMHGVETEASNSTRMSAVVLLQSMVSRTRSTSRSVWQYAVLIAQVIRVKKWRICPLVDVTEERHPSQ